MDDPMNANAEPPFHPGSLEGISRIRIDCEDIELSVEADPSLTDTIQLTVPESGNNLPSLLRQGDEIVIYQRGRYRAGRRTPTLSVPEQGCPPISCSHDKGDLNFERVNASIEVKHGSGDVRLDGGAGDFALSGGKGDVQVLNRFGNVALKVGSGDVRLSRCQGNCSISLGKGDLFAEAFDGGLVVKSGSGDVAASDGTGSLIVNTGSGDVLITRPRGQQIVVSTANGDVSVRNGSVSGLRVRAAKGDIMSSAQFLLPTLQQEPIETNIASQPAADDDSLTTRILRSKGVEFLAGDQGVRISSPGFQLEAGDQGVRISRGKFQFEAGDHGVRVSSGGDGHGDFDLETASGDIMVELPSGVPVRVEALVNGGDVRSDVPLVSVGRPGPRGSTQRFVGVTDPQAGARLNVRVKSDRGDIRLRSVAGLPGGVIPTPPAPPPAPPVPPRLQVPFTSPDATTTPIPMQPPATPAATRDQRMRAILDRLSRGELTIDEADRLLAEIG